jgi:hypothetical protein
VAVAYRGVSVSSPNPQTGNLRVELSLLSQDSGPCRTSILRDEGVVLTNLGDSDKETAGPSSSCRAGSVECSPLYAEEIIGAP